MGVSNKKGVSLGRPAKWSKSRNVKGTEEPRKSNGITESVAFTRSKQLVSDSVHVCGKILRSTGKAAWITGTTFLVLVVPLIIEMDREQQLSDLEAQQSVLLGASPSSQSFGSS
eukprot:TRINITY_DN6440_c0_g1_i1.p1 TRINITY_DN6440_c0_g1~~TRINITY_DN6440_c0_g1_i1.p1  ORF type:complete len:114 (+),score=11.55 TRINITY_DN6440_c0_g1_i1:115-456(+)